MITFGDWKLIRVDHSYCTDLVHPDGRMASFADRDLYQITQHMAGRHFRELTLESLAYLIAEHGLWPYRVVGMSLEDLSPQPMIEGPNNGHEQG